MLVARRDPPFQDAPHDGGSPVPTAYPHAQPPRLLRFVTVMQLFGSLLAVPIGLASAYSIYRANFSPETTCQTLRAGIVSMLDKSVDTSTRRMLVRGDVVKFEQDCAAVDPDAIAAFKTLLTVEKKPAPVAPPAVKTPAVAEPVRREAAVSDAQWLEGVRQAMAVHKQEPVAAAADRPLVLGSPPHPLQRPAVRSEPVATVRATALAVAPVALAPAIATPPPPDADHPVPPNAIPDPSEMTAKPVQQPSRISRWIARVPLFGPVWDNGQQ
jgi:hypothetical protein